MSKRHTVIDIFAGCGGLSLGLYQAGWEGLFAVEKNPCAFETLDYNLISGKNGHKHFAWPDWLPKQALDIIELNKNYSEQLKALQGSVDLVAGGPPCQGFSMAGKRVESDIRNQLVFEYCKFIEMVKPKMLLFENVKGFTCAFNKKDAENVAVPYSKIVTDKLRELGYDVEPQVIDFSQFGVPQRRKRFILVGILKGEEGSAKQFLVKLKAKKDDFLKRNNLTDNPTISDAISDLLQKNGLVPTPDRPNFQSGKYGKATTLYQKYMRADAKEENPQSHSFAKHSDEKTKRFQNLLNNCPEEKRGKRISGDEREQWGIKQRGLVILKADQSSPTMTGLPDDYLHYCEPRIMTVRECARIQSFPDWFEFKSKYTTGGEMRKKEVPRYSQVGNAIPPLFARQAGEVLIEMCDEK